MVLSHDERIVEMRFDNEHFERNVQTTLGTLDKLKYRLGLLDSSSLGLDVDTRAANGIDNISSSVNELSNRFSSVGVVGKRVLENLTDSAMSTAKAFANNTIGIVQEKGQQRALNLEQAKFQLKGLGIAWEDIKDDIDYAVLDTAYGLDEAAKAAAQVSASGIQLGDDMKATLRGISGIAAMTNSDYSEIAQIFASIAGNGKVMASEFNRIGQRGLNARAALAKYMGITEEEVRAIASDKKGEGIDPLTFFKAMDHEFGEHAKKANETYTGALANAKAALGRIGELYYTPLHESQRRIFNALIPVINLVKSLASESTILNKILERLENKASFFETFFKKPNENAKGWEGAGEGYILVGTFLEMIDAKAQDLIKIFDVLREAWREVFPKSSISIIERLTEIFKEFGKTSWATEENLEKIRSRAESLFNILKAGLRILGKGLEIIKPFAKAALNAFGLVIDFFGYLSQLFLGTRHLKDDLADTGTGFEWVANNIRSAGDALSNWVEEVRNAVREGDAFAILASNIIGGFRWMAEAINAGIQSLKKWAIQAGISLDPKEFTIEDLGTIIKRILGVIFDIMEYGAERLGQLFKPITDALVGGAKGLFKEANPDNIIAIATGGGIGYLAYKIGQILYNIKAWTGLIPPAINNLLFSIGRSMRYKSYALMTVAAVGSIIVAIIALGRMDQASLDRGIHAIQSLGVFVALIVGVFKIMSMITAFKDKTVSTSKMMYSIAAVFFSIGAAIALMAGALRTISSLTSTQIAASLGVIALLLIGVSVAIIAIARFAGMELGNTWKSIAALSLIFLSMASLMKVLGKFDIDQMEMALGILIFLMSMLGFALVMTAIAQDGDWKVVAASALPFLALIRVAKAVLKLSKVPEDALKRSMSAVFMLYGMIVFLSAVAARAGKISKAFSGVGTAFLLLALSMDVMIPAVLVLAAIPEKQLKRAMNAIATLMLLMTIFGGVMAYMSKSGLSTLGAGGAIILMAAAFDVLIPAVLSFAYIPAKRLMRAVGAISLLMLILGGVTAGLLALQGYFFTVSPQQMLAIGAAIVMLALAMQLLTPTIIAFALVPTDKLFAAVGAVLLLAIVMSALVAGVGLLAGRFPMVLAAMPVFAASVLILSVALFISAVALSAFAVGLATVWSVFLLFEGHGSTILLFSGILLVFAVVLAVVGAALVVFGVGLAVASVAVLIASIAIALLGGALLFGAAALATITATLITFTEHAEAIRNVLPILTDLVPLMTIIGLSMIVLAAGTIALGVGLVVFSAGVSAAAGAIALAGKAFAVLGDGFYILTVSIVGSVQIIINLFASLIDYALGVAEAIGIITGKISNEDLSKIRAIKEELRNALDDSGINNIESQLKRDFDSNRKAIEEIGEDVGLTVNEGFTHTAGKFDGEVVQNGLLESMGNIDLSEVSAILTDKVPRLTDIPGFSDKMQLDVNDIFNGDSDVFADSIEKYMSDGFVNVETAGMTSPLAEGIEADFLGNADNIGSNFTDRFLDAAKNRSSERSKDSGNAIFSEFINGYNEPVSTEAYDAGVGTTDTIIDGAKDEMIEVAAPAGDWIWDQFAQAWTRRSDEKGSGLGEETADQVIDGMEASEGDVETAGYNLALAGLDGLNQWDRYYDSGRYNAEGFWRGLNDSKTMKTVTKSGRVLYTTVDKSLRKAAQIKSPSKKMKELGEYTAEGYAVGYKDEIEKLRRYALPSLSNSLITYPFRKAKQTAEDLKNEGFIGTINKSREKQDDVLKSFTINTYKFLNRTTEKLAGHAIVAIGSLFNNDGIIASGIDKRIKDAKLYIDPTIQWKYGVKEHAESPLYDGDVIRLDAAGYVKIGDDLSSKELDRYVKWAEAYIEKNKKVEGRYAKLANNLAKYLTTLTPNRTAHLLKKETVIDFLESQIKESVDKLNVQFEYFDYDNNTLPHYDSGFSLAKFDESQKTIKRSMDVVADKMNNINTHEVTGVLIGMGSSLVKAVNDLPNNWPYSATTISDSKNVQSSMPVKTAQTVKDDMIFTKNGVSTSAFLKSNSSLINTAMAVKRNEQTKNAAKQALQNDSFSQQQKLNQLVAQAQENNFLLGKTATLLNKDKGVYIDGNKLVGAVANKMDKQLGINVARRARGS